MKTDYPRHDVVYQRLRTEGKIGWDGTQAAYEATERQLRAMIDSGQIPARGRLLEMGCGAGNASLWLEQQGYEVTGVDIAPTAIDWAKAKARDTGAAAQFCLGNVLAMTFLDEEQFDLVLDGHCLHCIIGTDRPRFLSEAFRVLKPRGRLLLDTMCGPVIGTRIAGHDHATKCTLLDGIATRYFGLQGEIERETTDAGFTLVSSTKILQEEGHSMLTIVAAKP